MDLFFVPNTIAAAVGITLEEAGATYTPHAMSFANNDQNKPEFLAVNPKGRVPAVVTGGETLTEAGAILEWIAATHPEADLVPSDPMQAFRMREMMYYLGTTMHIAHAHKFRGARWANEESSWQDMAAKVPETMAASCAHIEATCEFAPFVAGDKFSLADAYLYVVSTWLEGDGVDVSAYPNLAKFVASMASRDSVKAVKAAGML